MTGTSNSGRKKGFFNPWSWQLHLKKKEAEAICKIKDEEGFDKLGPSTYIIHDYILHHENRLRELLGSEFDEFFKNWSKTMIEQKGEKRQKAISTYKFYGFTQEDAEKAYELQPDEEPLNVVRERNATRKLEINTQFIQAETQIMNDKHEVAVERAEEQAEVEHLNNPEYKALLDERKSIDEFFVHALKDPTNPAYSPERLETVRLKQADNAQKIKNFVFETQQLPQPR